MVIGAGAAGHGPVAVLEEHLYQSVRMYYRYHWVYHLGDARYDADGYFTIVDHLKELIKFKGYQVAPAELEAVLIGHPAVTDAAVIPVRDDEAGEVPKAFVVLASEVAPEDLLAYVAARVAPYKQIRQLEVIDAIPKSASGKILRRELVARERERAAARWSICGPQASARSASRSISRWRRWRTSSAITPRSRSSTSVPRSASSTAWRICWCSSSSRSASFRCWRRRARPGGDTDPQLVDEGQVVRQLGGEPIEAGERGLGRGGAGHRLLAAVIGRRPDADG